MYTEVTSKSLKVCMLANEMKEWWREMGGGECNGPFLPHLQNRSVARSDMLARGGEETPLNF